MQVMARHAIWALLGCMGSWAACSVAIAQPARSLTGGGAERDLVVRNRATHAIDQIYVSPHQAERWGDDRLGDESVEPGKTFRLRLGRESACVVDVQIVYDDASEEEVNTVNICRTHQIVFDGSHAVAAQLPAGEPHHLVIANASSRPIQQVFVSPPEATQWGDDLLGNHSLSVGERAGVEYYGSCLADLRVVFDNRSAEERRGLDLCGLHGVLIAAGWDTADEPPVPKPETPLTGDNSVTHPLDPMESHQQNADTTPTSPIPSATK